MSWIDNEKYPKRRKPASGVHIDLANPTIVFLTVCTKDRKQWLLLPDAGICLFDAWQKSNAWKVGYYLLVPDHIHLFCSPADLNISMDRWVSYWKRQV